MNYTAFYVIVSIKTPRYKINWFHNPLKTIFTAMRTTGATKKR